MSDRTRSHVADRESGPTRATGLLSAVLLVVLLASGWSESTTQPAEGHQVTSCEARTPAAVRVSVRREQGAAPRLCAVEACREWRVPPRTRRVDSWGLPPPRAPTR